MGPQNPDKLHSGPDVESQHRWDSHYPLQVSDIPPMACVRTHFHSISLSLIENKGFLLRVNSNS